MHLVTWSRSNTGIVSEQHGSRSCKLSRSHAFTFLNKAFYFLEAHSSSKTTCVFLKFYMRRFAKDVFDVESWILQISPVLSDVESSDARQISCFGAWASRPFSTRNASRCVELICHASTSPTVTQLSLTILSLRNPVRMKSRCHSWGPGRSSCSWHTAKSSGHERVGRSAGSSLEQRHSMHIWCRYQSHPLLCAAWSDEAYPMPLANGPGFQPQIWKNCMGQRTFWPLIIWPAFVLPSWRHDFFIGLPMNSKMKRSCGSPTRVKE